jgi:carbon storage regulator CsrA
MAKTKLVLTRKRNQSLWIDDTKVTIQEIRGNAVRLMFDADETVEIWRDEIKEAIDKERESAGG